MDSRPLLYELNTRCWLQEWGVREGRAVTLADVPVEEFARWRRQGFSHVWLMGAWTNGPLSREVFLRGGDLGAHLDEALPGWTKEDIAGSPYAIQKYTVPAALGGEAGLRRVRRELNRAGLRLLLDFVPNHLGLDHPWAGQHPDWFMPGEPGADGSFEQTTVHGPRWLSHGRDPWFPAWADTVQVDIRRPQPRAALIRDLAMIQERCDGVRCDMAMLLLSDVFSRTWAGHPLEGPGAAGEFWGEVMDTCGRPGFTFLAEVYWDLEERLQELGFDFTYDKKVTDHVMTGDGAALQRHLQGKSAGHLQRSVHFLENHDEPRVAGRLGGAAHEAASLLILALPGMGFLHQGQREGARTRASVHLRRRRVEPVQERWTQWYDSLLQVRMNSRLGVGRPAILRLTPLGEDRIADQLVAIQWEGEREDSGFDLVIVNVTGQGGCCALDLSGLPGSAVEKVFRSRLGTAPGVDAPTPAGVGRPPTMALQIRQLGRNRIVLEVPPHGIGWWNVTSAT